MECTNPNLKSAHTAQIGQSAIGIGFVHSTDKYIGSPLIALFFGSMRNPCYERNCGFHKYIVKIYKIILKKQCYREDIPSYERSSYF